MQLLLISSQHLRPHLRLASCPLQIADLQQRVKEAEAKVVELEEALGSSEHEKEREKAIREQLTEELRVADENFQERSKDIAQQLDSCRSELRKMKVRRGILQCARFDLSFT